jgi:mannose-6-phosphate isomerase-like protein (cupin superfamily)
MEVITDQRGRRLAVLLAMPEVVVTESRYAAAQPGAQPHVHRRHADIFHVVGGAVVFSIGPDDAKQLAEAGQTVIIPPGVVHGFDVSPVHDSVFLNAHAPGLGFDVYLKERRGVRAGPERDALAARYDSYDPPADGGRAPESAVLSAAGLIETWTAWAPHGEASEVVGAALARAFAAYQP